MHVFHLNRSCPQRLGVGYKHNFRAPDELMLRRAHDRPSTERERLERRDLDKLLLMSMATRPGRVSAVPLRAAPYSFTRA